MAAFACRQVLDGVAFGHVAAHVVEQQGETTLQTLQRQQGRVMRTPPPRAPRCGRRRSTASVQAASTPSPPASIGISQRLLRGRPCAIHARPLELATGLGRLATKRQPQQPGRRASAISKAAIERCDQLLLPSGFGVIVVIEDPVFITHLRRLGGQARWIASVCTSSPALDAAGLLKGRRATSHGAWRDLRAG